MKYLPRETSRYDVFTRDPVGTRLRFLKCDHKHTTYFSLMDRYPRDMPKWTGQVCTRCRRVMSMEKVDVGLPKSSPST